MYRLVGTLVLCQRFGAYVFQAQQTMALNYTVYENLNVVPPLVVVGISCLIGFVYAAVPFVFAQCCSNRKIAKRIKLYGLLGMYAAISFVFRDAIQKDLVVEKKKMVHKFVLYNRRISPVFIPAFFLVLPGLFSCFFASFWQMFLTGESYTCDPDLDCFPFHLHMGPIQENPIENCSDYITDDNITIICYQFVFKFADATALIGGLLTFTAVSIKLLGTVLVWSMSPGEEREEDGCCSGCFWDVNPVIENRELHEEKEEKEETNFFVARLWFYSYKLALASDEEEEETDNCYSRCYNSCSRCCNSCCFPSLKLFVRFVLVVLPLSAAGIALVLYFTVPLVYSVVQKRLIFVQYFAYTLTTCYLGVLSFLFFLTLHCSKANTQNTTRSSYKMLN